MDRHAPHSQPRALRHRLGVNRLMLQNERVQDGSANDATPSSEYTGTGIILPVSEDFAHHGTMTAPTFHKREGVPELFERNNPGLA
jgi:hypothetical protein